MQNLIYKILRASQSLKLSLNLGWFFGLILSLFLAGPLHAQNSSAQEDLLLADSLFAAGKYTESFELYETILRSHQQLSQGMLLKMAFIKEGLGDFSQALYYLNLYYANTSDKRALRKMEELARQHQLQGYQFTDLEFFRTFFQRFNLHIIFGLVATALFIFSLIVWQKRRGLQPVGTGVVFVLLLGLLFTVINFGRGDNRAIILTDQAYLREAPSSAADVVGIIGKGHRVQVYRQNDVWVKIKWEDRKVYVRENHLARIES